MTTATLTYTGELVVTSCWCGIRLAVPSSLYKEARANHNRDIYCPLGHTFVYSGETEAAKYKRWYENAEDQRARAAAERDQIEASRRAWKGQVTKLRKHVTEGECPFCGQHLRDLARHVSRKHGDEAARELTEADATA